MTGATIVAAQAPETKSDANRRPRFFVFQTLASLNEVCFGIGESTFDGSISTLGTGESRPFNFGVIVGSLRIQNDQIGRRINRVN